MSRHVALPNRRRRLSLASLVTAGLFSTSLMFAAVLLIPRAQPAASASAGNDGVSARVTVVQKDVIGQVSRPQIVTIVPPPAPEPVSRDARRTASPNRLPPEPPRKGLTHRVARFFTGDGRHAVRPFPTPSPVR